MAQTVEWSSRAIANLEEITLYIAVEQGAPLNARRLLIRIMHEAEMLTLFPYAGHAVKGRKSLREKSVKNYRIIYTPLPNGVKIVAVIHGSREIGVPGGSGWDDE